MQVQKTRAENFLARAATSRTLIRRSPFRFNALNVTRSSHRCSEPEPIQTSAATSSRCHPVRHREPPVPIWLELHTDHEPVLRVQWRERPPAPAGQQALVAFGEVWVGERVSQWIAEHGCRPLERDAVLPGVACRLGCIPFAVHTSKCMLGRHRAPYARRPEPDGLARTVCRARAQVQRGIGVFPDARKAVPQCPNPNMRSRTARRVTRRRVGAS